MQGSRVKLVNFMFHPAPRCAHGACCAEAVALSDCEPRETTTAPKQANVFIGERVFILICWNAMGQERTAAESGKQAQLSATAAQASSVGCAD
jgi:hypothetical protein